MDAIHQTWFECENCSYEGYVQSVGEPHFCPICGDKVEHNLIEFTLIEGDQPVKEVIKEVEVVKVVYKEREERRFRGQGSAPTTGIRGARLDPNHKIVNTPPQISSVKKDNERRQYTVDCRYTGLGTTIISHLVTWHGMTLKEAKEAVKVGNHNAVDITTEPPVCPNIGLYPLTAEVTGYILDQAEERRYRFKLSCGYEAPRTSVLKHMCVHHGYSKEDARKAINLQDGNVDLTNREVRLYETVTEI